MPLQMVPTRRQHAVQRVMPVLLDAGFAAAKAAPLGSPLGADVGALAVVDTNGVMSQSGSALVVNGALAAGDRITAPTVALARLVGRALRFSLPSRTTIGAGNVTLGLDDTAADSTSLDHAIDLLSATTWRVRADATVLDTQTFSAGSWSFAFVLRPTGALLLARDGTSGPYTLAWVFGANTAAEFIKFRHAAATSNYTLDDLRVVDLPAPWNDPYGIAQARLVNPPATVAPYPHTSDFVLEFSFTYTAGQAVGMAFRTHTPGQSSNFWRCYATAGGAVSLDQVVATVSTNRISVASTFSDTVAYRVVVIADGNVYKVYVNDVLKGTYTDAGNFQVAETVGWVYVAGVPITEAVFWPRRVALPADA